MAIIENGILAGNLYDKYGSRNPVVRYIMKGFHDALFSLIVLSDTSEVHEVGCGEGHLSISLAKQNIRVVASDFSEKVINIARDNARKADVNIEFKVASIHDLSPADSANLVLCSEVLEHLDDPENAIQVLHRMADPFLIVSVPNEPMWRILNMARFSYIAGLGNTPGHVQHWSRRSFLQFLSPYFDIVDVRTPIPWTMVLCRSKDNNAQ